MFRIEFSLNRPMPPKRSCELPLTSTGRPTRSALNLSMRRSSRGRTLYFCASSSQTSCSSASFSGISTSEIACLAPVARFVELPDIVRERGPAPLRSAMGSSGESPRSSPGGRCRGCRTSRNTARGDRPRRYPVERVRHAHALDRVLLDAVDGCRVRVLRPRAVGATSMTWWNCERTSPRAEKPPANARSSHCASRPNAKRPALSTGRACPWRAPSRRHSGYRPLLCRTRRCVTPRTRVSPAPRRR